MAACPDTFFAPPERADLRLVQHLSHRFEDAGFFGGLMDKLPDMVMLLNPQRQIVYANRAALEAGGVRDRAQAVGLRPGELLRCKNACSHSGGCGTSEFCRYCGQTQAILASQAGKPVVEECRLIVERDTHEEAMDLRVWTSPTEFDGEPLTFLSLVDIAEEKRRIFLERSFLHDLVNTATALRGFCSLLKEDKPGTPEQGESVATLDVLAERILEEIRSHQLLMAAESNQLKPNLRRLDALKLLRQLFTCYNRPELRNGRTLALAPDSAAVDFHSDDVLVSRVIGNMIKNALEASPPGATVTLGCRRQGDKVAFWVHNPTHMPDDVRLQVFYRSFSTKGPGRGLGTYSMRYFTEKYLGGSISFTSTKAEGTTFTARYPVAAKA